MIISIYIRPLVLEDAKVSYLWRNDPVVWTYTGFKPDRAITEEMEMDWLRSRLNKPDQSRFAICVKELNTYIGNVQLLDIHDNSAEFHLFIGNKLYWGKGIGFQATVLMLKYGFSEKNLDVIYLKVHPANIAALSIYEKAGFKITGKDNGRITMDISKEHFAELWRNSNQSTSNNKSVL